MEGNTARKAEVVRGGGTEPPLAGGGSAATAGSAAPALHRKTATARSGAKLALRIAIPALGGLLFLASWQLELFHRLWGLRTYQLPLPSAIAQAMGENASLLWDYTLYTWTEAVLGLLFGSALGFLVALIATAWPRWGAGGVLLVAALNAVPIVALAPIMNLWFGGGIGSRIAIVAISTMAAMAMNVHKGMSSVDPLSLDLMHGYAAKKLQVFRYLRIPASLPYVFTALKINTTASMIGAIVGEFFFSSRGLGYLLSNSIKIAKMPLGWSCIIVAAALGVAFYLLMEGLEKMCMRWHPSRRG
ncbi:NitT/TauT family transport system permease protein [Paenibacillus phyllosphaerae]|uniref:NitT/TauT family transport system permease protein n=1 Tax=Paenibacillus phyllosphaerae TaxID=274593 RepID=A0A7W5FN86_9BACL|nr:ABC transporter permease [Paenibacillus phyllosphaerae]MBB3110774.1 NitT/TauT family transport system permease protein [Paenibacillus phyllosphaerae]